jgi:hypothetical protein
VTAAFAGNGVDAVPQATEPVIFPIGRGLPLIGHLPWFYTDTNGFLARLARSQGDVASFRLGREERFCSPIQIMSS